MVTHPLFELIKDKLKGSHDPTHIERVLKYGQIINKVHKANWKIIEASIILHEITKNNPESSREYLKDFTDEEIEKIIYCIKKHHDFVDKPDSLEAKTFKMLIFWTCWERLE